MTSAASLLLLDGSSSGRRPTPVKQPPLPPWDQSDASGDVHTTQPPDLIIPKGYDRDFFRGDIVGRCLPVAPPPVPGDNGNYGKRMVMSYFLPYYSLPQYGGTKQVDAILTSHAEANFSHFHLDRSNLDNAGLSLKQQMDLIAYVQSWGFFSSFWACGSGDARAGGWAQIGPTIAAFLNAVVAAGLAPKSVCLAGEELNNGCPPGPAGVDSILNGCAAICNPADLPLWAHFTENYPGYPEQALVDQCGGNVDEACALWWQRFLGKVKGECWQADPDQSAGLQGAKLWDTRRILYRADPSFKVAAFEVMATNQFNGRCTEEYGALRNLELVYCTSDGTAGPVAGGCNGFGRLPDGTPL